MTDDVYKEAIYVSMLRRRSACSQRFNSKMITKNISTTYFRLALSNGPLSGLFTPY